MTEPQYKTDEKGRRFREFETWLGRKVIEYEPTVVTTKGEYARGDYEKVLQKQREEEQKQ